MDKTSEQLAVDIIKKAVIRFGKVFLASGAASAALIPPLMNLNYHDVKSYVTAIVIAFVSGGALGVEKLWSQLYGPQSNQTKDTPSGQNTPPGIGTTTQA